jgi:caffeoyl-CoA O-methyltransferase
MPTRPLTFADKLLPTQPPHIDLFVGEPDAVPELLYATILRASGIRSPLEEFDLTQTDRFTMAEMASNPVSLRFLQILIRLSRARRVLEIGAFIGLSTMNMAKALPPGGEVVSIEKGAEFAGICRSNFRRNGLDHMIRLLEGDAMAVIDQLPRDQLFDLIFIDGNKECYQEYFTGLDPLLSPGGLIVVDDALFHGDVLNVPARTPKGRGVASFLEAASQANGYDRVLLPISNGMMLMFKPRAEQPR